MTLAPYLAILFVSLCVGIGLGAVMGFLIDSAVTRAQQSAAADIAEAERIAALRMSLEDTARRQ